MGIAVTSTRYGPDPVSKRGNFISELLAESVESFYYAPFNSVLTFVKNEQGEVDHLKLSLNGREYIAARQP